MITSISSGNDRASNRRAKEALNYFHEWNDLFLASDWLFAFRFDL